MTTEYKVQKKRYNRQYYIVVYYNKQVVDEYGPYSTRFEAESALIKASSPVIEYSF